MRKEWVVPDIETYEELAEAFRGGNTHANRYCVAPEDCPPMIHHNVKSYDRSSSYPDVMCNMEFPLGKWQKRNGLFDETEITKYKKLNRAMVFRVKFFNIRLKDELWGCPYLSKDKAYNLRKLTSKQIYDMRERGEIEVEIDNGRILEASVLHTCITDVDFDIISGEYKWDRLEITDLKVCRYNPLPKDFIDLIQYYYKNKTELKGVEEQKYLYAESKAKINSLYGMAAQKTVKNPICFNDSDEPDLDNQLYIEEQADKQHQIDDSIRKAFLPYSIGVWVTAWARYWLEQAIVLIHNTPGARFLYTDTDSVKFTGEVDFTELNARIKANSERTHSYATDRKGNVHYMGVYEYEETYEQFATMGAKKYIYGTEEKFHLTVAGLVKYKEGIEVSANELKKLGGFSQFRAGTEFIESGGMEAIYNDNKIIGTINIDGHDLLITRNICLKPSTYTLGLTNEYSRLLKMLQIGVDNHAIL